MDGRFFVEILIDSLVPLVQTAVLVTGFVFQIVDMKSKAKLTFSFPSRDEKEKWAQLLDNTIAKLAPAKRTQRTLAPSMSESSLSRSLDSQLSATTNSTSPSRLQPTRSGSAVVQRTERSRSVDKDNLAAE